MIFEHPRSIFKKIVTNLPPGGGGEECESIVTPSFKNNADPDPLYTDPDSDSKNPLSIPPTGLVTI